MKKVLCKKCSQCGLFNDFTIEKCECGQKSNNIAAQFIDTDELSPEQYGEINTSLKAYVQKCSACGALNYTDNPTNPVRVCYNCNKTRIATISPVEFIEETKCEQKEAAISESNESSVDSRQIVHQNQQIYVEDYDTDDDDDDDSAQWQGILGNIQKIVGSTSVAQANLYQGKIQPAGGQGINQTKNNIDDEDDDEDVEEGDWSVFLGVSSKQESASEPKQLTDRTPRLKAITLTAIRYGRLSFTVTPEQTPYLLGRSANQGSFLCQDGRVGNEHCYLIQKNSAWYVRDNNSKNGTAVNSRDIGLNGECMLSDGDELKLGHHSDSMAFRITIN